MTQAMTPPDLLARAGEALFGEGWQQPLAWALGVNPRRLRNWLAGRLDVPPGVWSDLRDMLDAHGVELRDIIDELLPLIRSGAAGRAPSLLIVLAQAPIRENTRLKIDAALLAGFRVTLELIGRKLHRVPAPEVWFDDEIIDELPKLEG